MTYATAWASQRVVAAVIQEGAAYEEFAAALRVELESRWSGRVKLLVTTSYSAAVVASPNLMVTAGAAPFAAALQQREKVGVSDTPLLAALIPRLRYEQEVVRLGPQKSVTALFLDQPPSRQAALIRAALPDANRVGLLTGPESAKSVAAVGAALMAQKLVPTTVAVAPQGLFVALREVMDDSDVVLALPDRAVFNSGSIVNILTATYRREIPLIGFSPAYVKAGAVMSLYVTPAQVGRAAAETVINVLEGMALPAPASPSEFVVEINPAVARSLGLNLDVTQIRKRMQALELRQ